MPRYEPNDLTVHHADVSGIALSGDVTWAFHRLFSDINGIGSVISANWYALAADFSATTGDFDYEPGFEYNANGLINSVDLNQVNRRIGTTYTYTPTGAPILSGPSTTVAAGASDISSWAAAGTNAMYYGGSNVIEERQSGSTGAYRQEVWGLGYVNSLIEQDTATSVDSGGVLPTTHLGRYALETSFGGTGTALNYASNSYDSVAIQPANGAVVAAGNTGSALTITRDYANGTPDTTFGSDGTIAITEGSEKLGKEDTTRTSERKMCACRRSSIGRRARAGQTPKRTGAGRSFLRPTLLEHVDYSELPDCIAHPSTLRPALSLVLMSAPLESTNTAASFLWFATARNKGVRPVSSLAFTSAPPPIRSWMVNTLPAPAAVWSGVMPSSVAALASAPRPSRRTTTSAWPRLAATYSGDGPSSGLRGAPESRIRSTRSV